MKKLLLLSAILFTINAVTQIPASAQQILPPVAKQRPADYEYLSAPDSTGKRTLLKMPPSSLNRSQTQQLKLPYPIIFIHGLWSNCFKWNNATDSMDIHYGTTYGGRVDFCLNFDGDNTSANTNFYPNAGADLALYTDPDSLTAGDYYYVNFDVGSDGSFNPINTGYDVISNQSAVVKQGLALKWVIYFVLQATGRDKVVLMGHSMGGLAAREYIQNSSIWQPDGQHHVAKLVTTGTPHGGSNMTTIGVVYGPDGQSEGVRDIRRTYYYSGNDGVYLESGIENLVYMEDQLLFYFYNSDVNCDGIGGTSQNIIGLNDKSIITIPPIDYSCIIGECPNCLLDLYQGDGVVNNVSANLTTIYPSLDVNLFHYYDNITSTQIHTVLMKQFKENMWGLDEPNEYWIAYNIDFDTIYTAFTTEQPVGGYPPPVLSLPGSP